MSQQTDTVNIWLKELASLAAIDDLSLNNQGVCALRFGDRVEIVFEIPEQSEVLHLYCPVCEVPTEEQASFFQRLLEWNMFGLETRGASFAIDRESNRVMLCYSIPIAGTDILEFQNTVGNFAEVCERFCNELSAEPANFPVDDMSQMNFLRG